jgi:hypothetical protein
MQLVQRQITYDSDVIFILKTLCNGALSFAFTLMFPLKFSLNQAQQSEHVSTTVTFCDPNSHHTETKGSRQSNKDMIHLPVHSEKRRL